MEEAQLSEEAARVGEGPQQEQIQQTLSVPENELVKVEENQLVDNAAVSPQLFALAQSAEQSAAIPQLEHVAESKKDTLEQTMPLESLLPGGPSIHTQQQLSHDFDALQALDADQFAIGDATLPQLTSLDDMSMPDAATSIIDSEPRVQAFAKLEFDDGQFYMNTWAVELGRDMRAAKKALQQEFEVPDAGNTSSRHRSNSSVDGGQSSIRRQDESRRVAGSVISETGGILNYGPEGPPKTSKSSKRRTKSEGSATRMVSRSNSIMELAMETDSVNPTDLLFDRPPLAVQPVNPQTHLPSPDECPLIPIHPPATDTGAAVGHRGISRRHVKIQYSFDRRLFEMEVKGRNGAFVDEIYYGAGEIAELRSGSYIQIGGVGIKFILPNVAEGETGAEPTLASEAVSAMSFDFEDGRGDSVAMVEMSDSSSELPDDSDEERAIRRRISSGEESDEEDEEIVPSSRGKKSGKKHHKSGKSHQQPPKIKLKLKTKHNVPDSPEEMSRSPRERTSLSAEMDEESLKALGIDVPLAMIPPRRKGPGRPPKNGFMSKREEASLKKQAREAAKAQAVADGTLPPEALLSPIDPSDKRKFLKKENSKEIHESIEGNDGSQSMLPPKIPKEKKAPKPPKSPSPFVDEASLTPEQLAKPQHSYVVMIHEALSNCPAGQMSLPQIYKAIERKYPYFKFKVTTPGWQSSIRHNLSQHPAFKKTETREGKGWMWCLDPDVSIEKEKRPRRPSPPPMSQQPYFPQGGTAYRPPFPFQGMSQVQTSGSTPGQFPYSAAPSSYAAAQAVKGPNGLPASASTGDIPASYQSPYGSSAAKANANGIATNNGRPNAAAAVPAGANPYLMAQTMHQPQPSPLRTASTPQNGSVNGQVPPQQGAVNFSAQALNAISKYKSALMQSLTMPNKEIIINTVIDKVYGRPYKEFELHGDRTAAAAIERPLLGLLQQIRQGEQNAERQRVSQTPATPVQSSGVAPPPSSGQQPGQSTVTASHPTATQAQAQSASNSTTAPTTAASSTVQNPAPTNVASQVAQSTPQQAPAITPPTNQAAQAETPVASPITPVQAASPSSALNEGLAATNGASNILQESTAIAPNKANDQKQFLSILSQLGSSSNSSSINAAKQTIGEVQPSDGTNGTRGTKRPLDVEEEQIATKTKDSPINGNNGMEQARAAKRVAV